MKSSESKDPSSIFNDDEAKALAQKLALDRNEIRSLLGADEFGNVGQFSVFKNGIVAGMSPVNRENGYEEISSLDMDFCLGNFSPPEPISPIALLDFAQKNGLAISSIFADEVTALDRAEFYKQKAMEASALRENESTSADAHAEFFIGVRGKNFVMVWLRLNSVSARDAALLLTGYNPSKFKEAFPYTGEKGDVHPLDLMLETFEDVACDGQRRNLRAWLAVARERELQGTDIESWNACVSVFTENTVRAPTTVTTFEKPRKRRTWQDVAMPYVLDVYKSGQYSTAKALFNALEQKAGKDSPFDKGTGENRGKLFVREVNETLSLRTFQNLWVTIKSAG